MDIETARQCAELMRSVDVSTVKGCEGLEPSIFGLDPVWTTFGLFVGLVILIALLGNFLVELVEAFRSK